MPRSSPSDEIDTIAYAVSFMEAAKRLADTEWEDIPVCTFGPWR
jgi:hypothetical protein